MKAHGKTFAGCFILIAAMALGPSLATAASYEALDGLTRLEVAYDFRLDHPEKAALFLKLIHMTYKDESITGLAEPPRFVVVFNGAAVRLIAEDQPGVSQEDQAHLRDIASRITLMASDGIRMEGCLVAARLFKVDPDLFLREIEKVENAWISLAGYQAQKFSAMPVF